MKHCHNCNKPNRPEAKYCKWCGALLDDAPSAHGRTGGTDDFIGKDNILEDFGKKYVTACRLEEDFRNNNGEDSGSNLNCIITGDTGTGKAFLARKIAGLLYGCRLSDSPEATVKDASDWNEFNTRLDDNLAAIGRGVLVVTNCQKLVSPGERISQLDKLLSRMERGGGRLPIIILCGLETGSGEHERGFGEYVRANPDVRSKFGYRFRLLPFNDMQLTRLSVETICGAKYQHKYSISPDAEKKLRLVFKKLFRDRNTGENGVLALRLAQDAVRHAYARKSLRIEECDIEGEPFKAKSEEEIFAELESFVGLDEVKKEIRSIVDNIKRCRRDPGARQNRLSHYTFIGGPGTGKTTVARLFADILNSLEVLPGGQFIEVKRNDLVSQFVGETGKLTEQAVDKATGGVLFIDEAYSLRQDGEDRFGQEAVDTLVPLLENRRDKFVCIIAGYPKEMNSFLRSNTGLASRFSKTIVFKDFTAAQLKEIFLNLLKADGMELDGEAASRLGSVFEKIFLTKDDNFGNGRVVREFYKECCERQGQRVGGLSGDEYERQKDIMTWQDIAGDDAGAELDIDQALALLDGFVGMESVKEQIRTLAGEMQLMRRRIERGGKAAIRPVNIILTGNPGTGKTSVARVLGKVFKAIGICSEDKVVEKERTDIVGRYINEADKEMDKAVNEAMGGVLFIDEAYNLAQFDDMGHCSDAEGIKALDRLMTRMEDDRGKFVVICAGYKDRLEYMFKNANPGFSRRFTHRINIEDYNAEELTEIFRRMAGEAGLTLGTGALERALQYFRRLVTEKTGRDFGNAGEARTLLETVNGTIDRRLRGKDYGTLPDKELFTILPEDIPFEEPEMPSEEECLGELDSLIGLDSVKEDIRMMLDELSQKKLAAEIEGKEFEKVELDHYLFIGNPGTGKTTVARLMGRILHSLGALARPDVLEVKRSDLVAGYSGQTAMKTREVVNKAMGGVLFIDEAYSLFHGPHDEFGLECVDELLKLLEDRRGEFVCIAAGYPREMQQLMESNSGLASRFRKTIVFKDYDARQLMEIFRMMCRKQDYTIEPEADRALTEKFAGIYGNRGPEFGNGRTVRDVFKAVKAAAFRRSRAEMSALTAKGAGKAEAYRMVKQRLIKKEDII